MLAREEYYKDLDWALSYASDSGSPMPGPGALALNVRVGLSILFVESERTEQIQYKSYTSFSRMACLNSGRPSSFTVLAIK